MTVYNRTIQIRLTKEEKDRIVNRMRNEGHHNLSAWLRKKLLSSSLWMEEKVDVIHRYIVEQKKEEERMSVFGEKNLEFAS